MRTIQILVRCGAAAFFLWLFSLAAILGGASGCPAGGPFSLTPDTLAGEHVVPSNMSQAVGYGIYELQANDTELAFLINAYGLSGPVTAAHFHNAAESENGPVVTDLMPFLTEIRDDVVLAGRTSLTDWSIEDAVAEIRAGRIYVSLYTNEYPDGEIRGLVVLSQ